ncbi:MAG TPA: hypothetical protein VF026_31515 [Ktedonobacteraceae bacterium]
MDEISLLPQMLREQALSHREIVLPYQEAQEALDLLRRAQWAVWVGRMGEIPRWEPRLRLWRSDGS